MKRTEVRAPLAVTVLFLFAVFAPALSVRAQSEESELPQALGEFEAAPLPPPGKFDHDQ